MKTYKITIMTAFLFFGLSAQGLGEEFFRDKNLKPIVSKAPVMTNGLKKRIQASLILGSTPISAWYMWKGTYDVAKPLSWKSFPWWLAALAMAFPVVQYKVGLIDFQLAKLYDILDERKKKFNDFNARLDRLITEVKSK